MRYRTFPGTDVRVSEVGFGVWTVAAGWWGNYSDQEAADLLRRAYDLSVTLFDTGDTYGNGRGESLLPLALKDVRDKVQIGTKFGYDFYNNPGRRTGQQEWPQNWDPAFIRYALEQSLKRLETDYVDMYMLHNPRIDTLRQDDIFATLEKLKDEGKILSYGTALGPALQERQIEEAIYSYEALHCHGTQIIYNLFEQMLGEAVFPVARRHGGGVMVRVPHSSGLLEGKYTEDTVFPAGDHRAHRPRSWLTEGLAKLEALRFLTEGRDITIGQMAIKFILAEPSVTTVLPNIYNLEQLEEFAAAPDKPDLTPAEFARVQELYAQNFGLAAATA